MQARVTIVVGRSSQHLPHVAAEEVLEGTRGCGVAPLEADLTYSEYPIKILDQKSRVTRHKMIKFFKIQKSNHTVVYPIVELTVTLNVPRVR
jgi:hypothetical protein